MNQCFPKLFSSSSGNVNVKVDLTNYATKTYLKNVMHDDNSSFALKINWTSSKTEVNKLDLRQISASFS